MFISAKIGKWEGILGFAIWVERGKARSLLNATTCSSTTITDTVPVV